MENQSVPSSELSKDTPTISPADQVRLDAALTAGGIGTWAWDLVNDRIIADANLARLFSLSPEDAAGARSEVYLQAIYPEDRPHVAQSIQDAIAFRDRYDPEYRVVQPDGSARWLVARGKVVRDTDGKAVALDGVVVDITDQVGRRLREEFLAALAERARKLTDPEDVIADAVRSVGQFLAVDRCAFADIDIDADICSVYPDYCADETVMSTATTYPISGFGAPAVAEFAAGRAVAIDDIRADPLRVPPENIPAYDAFGIRAHITAVVLHSDRAVSCLSCHSSTPRHWKPEEVELIQAVVDRTWYTVEVARQQRALAREAAATTRILESITDGFYAIDPDWRFRYVNAQAERMLFQPREELVGRNIWDVFPEAIGGTFYNVYHRAMNERVTVTVEDYYAPLDSWMDVRVYPSADGLSVFFQNVNIRKKAEAERERLLAEQRARAERESLVSNIGRALLATTDPIAVQERAAALLGEALGTDRCYMSFWDIDRERVTVFQDYRRADLPSVKAEYSALEFAPLYKVMYVDGTAVIPDVHTLPALASFVPALDGFALRSILSVPFFDNEGRISAALWAAMSDGPRFWTPEEVSLAEIVAALTRTAVETAMIAERERNIATKLQDALQPALPSQIPGLSVASYTRAALQEANVGGDFYDIFPLDKELYALVLGDVSGKGLAAAQQLALIRNSLRTTLYLYRAPALAVSSLNNIVTAHRLLAGFVTAFVAIYDAGTGLIAYASCGHEPGLVYRAATATVEELMPTGPVLGVEEHGVYDEGSILLSPGDTLLLYTDGLSEAGSNRRELLGTEGLKVMMREMPSDDDLQAQAATLVSHVAESAGGVFRDDVAVILARRQ